LAGAAAFLAPVLLDLAAVFFAGAAFFAAPAFDDEVVFFVDVVAGIRILQRYCGNQKLPLLNVARNLNKMLQKNVEESARNKNALQFVFLLGRVRAF
jgi:hypothetical protein